VKFKEFDVLPIKKFLLNCSQSAPMRRLVVIISLFISSLSYSQEMTNSTLVNSDNVLVQKTQVLSNSTSSTDMQLLNQTLVLHEGWNLFSKSVITENESMDELFGEIDEHLVILKDEAGLVYWPLFEVNTIGDYLSNKGYYAKVDAEVSLTFTGEIIPESTPILLHDGWNIIPFYRLSEIDAAEFFESISPKVILVKDEAGLVYWPEYGLNSIGNLTPGRAYVIKMLDETIFQY
jgi:hypothetical protein